MPICFHLHCSTISTMSHPHSASLSPAGNISRTHAYSDWLTQSGDYRSNQCTHYGFVYCAWVWGFPGLYSKTLLQHDNIIISLHTSPVCSLLLATISIIMKRIRFDAELVERQVREEISVCSQLKSSCEALVNPAAQACTAGILDSVLQRCSKGVAELYSRRGTFGTPGSG